MARAVPQEPAPMTVIGSAGRLRVILALLAGEAR